MGLSFFLSLDERVNSTPGEFYFFLYSWLSTSSSVDHSYPAQPYFCFILPNVALSYLFTWPFGVHRHSWWSCFWMHKLFASAPWNSTLPLRPPQAATCASLPELMCLCERHSSVCALPPHATLVFCSHQSHWGIFKHFIFRMLFSTYFFKNSLPRLRGYCCQVWL